MKYTVDIKEVWTRSYTVDANSRAEAIEKANQAIEAGEEELNLDYSHTMATDLWTVFNLTRDMYED